MATSSDVFTRRMAAPDPRPVQVTLRGSLDSDATNSSWPLPERTLEISSQTIPNALPDYEGGVARQTIAVGRLSLEVRKNLRSAA
jgi:hypothetical protein